MKRAFSILIIISLLLLSGCGILDGVVPTEGTVYAPDMTVLTADGDTVKLSSFSGRPIILNFWASWHDLCKSQLQMLQEKYDELGDDVVFLAVCIADGKRETVETGKAFMKEGGYTFSAYFDTSNLATEVYGVTAIPTTFFIAPDNMVLGYAAGLLTEEGLDEGIRRITSSVSE